MKKLIFILITSGILLSCSKNDDTVKGTDDPVKGKFDVYENYIDSPIYDLLVAQKTKYPEGKKWTNDDTHTSLGKARHLGKGCVAFAFILSDAAFGDLPFREHKNFNNIRIGDIIRINDNNHSVIVLHTDKTNVTVAEGNYSGKIKWGRVFKRSDIKKSPNYIETRYPEK